jgi:predicted dehydrogenase
MTKKQQGVPRRTFLHTAGSVAAAGAAFGAPHLIPTGVLAAEGRQGANDRLTFGHIGVGGMGGGHLGGMVGRMKRGDVNIAAVCDVDDKRLENASRTAGPQADCYRDYRHVLDRKDIDAVVIATPDHWHAVQTVHAAERGKHVYVEKPACCTVEEGKAMIESANRAKIAVQVGSQGRSQPEAYLAHRYLANGNIGKISQVDCFHYNSPVGGFNADSDVPPELDWDLWLGPLRYRPFNRGHCHGVFRWLMESGGGQIRDRGAHVMSCAMWWMGADGTGPVEVEATGEAPKRGLWDSAVSISVKYTFKNPDWVLTWNQPGEPVPPEERTGKEPGGKISRPGYGAVYKGDKGTFVHWGGDGGTWAERKAREWEPGAGAVDVYRSPGHMEDWFEGIKTGKRTIMNIEAAADVAILTVLGNLSFLLKRKLRWDQAKREIVGDEQAQRLMGRPQRYPYTL